jgi:hypothetical protein
MTTEENQTVEINDDEKNVDNEESKNVEMVEYEPNASNDILKENEVEFKKIPFITTKQIL